VRQIPGFRLEQTARFQVVAELTPASDLLLSLFRANSDHHPAIDAELHLNGPDRRLGDGGASHIRKMPNLVSGIGAFNAAEIPSASTRRVSAGSMIPSSQSLAVE
jgi:hypothetical protein